MRAFLAAVPLSEISPEPLGTLITSVEKRSPLLIFISQFFQTHAFWQRQANPHQ